MEKQIKDITKQMQDCAINMLQYERMLSDIPENSILGRLCIKGYIKQEERKLYKLSLKLVDIDNKINNDNELDKT